MSESSAPGVLAYADDSITDECIAVAAIVVDADKVAAAAKILRAAKAGIGVPDEEPLHCRVMFAGDARKGTPWERVSPDAISDMIVSLSRDLKSVCQRPIVCRINPKAIPADATASGALFEGFEGKGWASFGYTGIFAALRDRVGAGVRVYYGPGLD